MTQVNDAVLVIYHYYEKDQSYIDNFLHFIQFAYRPELNYLIVIAGIASIVVLLAIVVVVVVVVDNADAV